MADLVEQFLAGLIKREGGYVNHAADRGGPTKFGITRAVARDDGYTGSMRDLPLERAVRIYRDKYFRKPGFEKLSSFSPAIAVELADTYVNMGAGNKERKEGPKYWLQRLLNAFNRQQRDYRDITVDGQIGPATIAALQSFLKVRGKLGEGVMVSALNCLQGGRYLDLIEANPSQEAFAYGWFANRIEIISHGGNHVALVGEETVVDTRTVEDVARSIAPQPTVAAATKAKMAEPTSLAGIALLVLALFQSPEAITALQGIVRSVANGDGAASIAQAVVGLGLILYRERSKQPR